MRTLLIAVGLLSLLLALLGVVLPLLPTTPFLLLAAGCFSRASGRLHAWLLRLPVFGPMLGEYARRGGLSPDSKRKALLLLWTGIAMSALMLASPVLAALLGALALALSLLILRLPQARMG